MMNTFNRGLKLAVFAPAVLSAAVAASILTTPAIAQSGAPFSKEFSAQPAGEYVLDKAHASVTWRISHLGLSQYTARFDKMDGKMNFASGQPNASSVEFTIDATSINTGLAPFNKKLQGAEYFAAEKNPNITFKSTKIEPMPNNKFRMTGDMTLRGVTKPMVWDVTFNGGLYNNFAQAHAVGFSAKGIVKRSEWGMKELIPMIGDDVEVLVEVEFNRRPQN
ncbi:MAG: YceI family protein [Burkholderiales bacterium]|jgi:polyisoprenoid-binding protein YceI|nr:YceI family protein [Nitrosomonadaceae bacterium]